MLQCHHLLIDDFESLRHQWMMDKHGYIFVYSIESEASLTELDRFFELHEQINENEHLPIVLVGNKKDLVDANPSRRQVEVERARSLAAKHKAVHIEASASTGENVTELFELLIRFEIYLDEKVFTEVYNVISFVLGKYVRTKLRRMRKRSLRLLASGISSVLSFKIQELNIHI